MKNFKKVLASILAVATLGSLATVPLNANAIALLLGYDTEGNEIWGGAYDVLVGFDDDGNPIIEKDIPDSAYHYGYDEDGNLVLLVYEDTSLTIGDSDGGNDDSGSGIGVSTVTCLQGDVNLDGVINGLDLVLLKKYILGLV